MPLSFALLVAVKVVMYLMIVLLSAHTSDMNYLLQIEVYHISYIAQYSYFTKHPQNPIIMRMFGRIS